MTNRVFLRPRAGLRLRLETGEPWPEAGEWVDGDGLYVRRRLADGDLEAADDAPPAEHAPAPPAGPAKSKGSARP